MALVPYTITAIERDTVDAATSGKQVVSGAICTMTDSAGNVALMYDDAAGTNPSTAKTTNGNGQVVVFVYPDIYTLTTNRIARKVKVDGSITVEFETFAEISSAVVQEGQRVICRERDNAEYIAQADGYIALAGDAVDGTGRGLALVLNNEAYVEWFGASSSSVDNAPFVMDCLSRVNVAIVNSDIPLGQPVVMDEPDRTIQGSGGFSYVTSSWSDRNGMINIIANNCTVKDIYLDAEGSISTGRNLRIEECDNTLIENVTGRGAPQCFIAIHDNCTNTFVNNCNSIRGYGILVDDASGSSGLFTSNNVFDGSNLNGDGIEVNCPTFGFSKFRSSNDTAKNYTGVAINQGLGIGLEICDDWIITGFECENLENDGLHFEDGANNGVCVGFKLKNTNTNGAVGSGGILIKDCDNIEIGNGLIENAQTQHGVVIFQPAGLSSNLSIHDIEIRGCGKSGVRVFGTENSSFKNITIIDANQLNTGNYGFQTVDTNTNLTIKSIKVIDGINPVAQGIRLEANSITGGELTGCNVAGCVNNIILDNGGNVYSKYGNIKSLTDTLTGTFTLSAATTTTLVANQNCSNDEFDITILPRTAAAANLDSVIVTFSNDLGFTLGHASAVGGEVFAYRINI